MDENNRYGFTYRSEVKIKFDGDYKSSLPAQYNQLPVRWALVCRGAPAAAPSRAHWICTCRKCGNCPVTTKWRRSGPSTTARRTPAGASSRAESHRQQRPDPVPKHEGFRDAYRIALGTTYFYDDNWTFRGGVAFDDSPVPAQNRSISIPDQDRFWVSAGTSYAFNKDASVDVGVSYMHGQKVTINEGPYTFNSVGKARCTVPTSTTASNLT